MRKLKRVVVDTSVIVKWLNRENEELLEKSDKVFHDGASKKLIFFTPELAKYETGNALLGKQTILPAVKISLTTLFTIPIRFITLDENLSSKNSGVCPRSEYHLLRRFIPSVI